MGRPIKNHCDYFSHDANMRNHRKVKALRNKYQNGYAIWNMLLEYLTGIDGNTFENSDIEFELMSGDFGVSVTEIRDVVNYCISLEMLFMKDGFVFSESLNERLAPVYEKRGRLKELSKKQLRVNGKFTASNADANGVSVTEKPQTKVKETKVNKREKGIPPDFEEFLNYAIEKKPLADKEQLRFKYQSWVENGWATGKNNPILNWKSTLLNTLPYINEVSNGERKMVY